MTEYACICLSIYKWIKPLEGSHCQHPEYSGPGQHPATEITEDAILEGPPTTLTLRCHLLNSSQFLCLNYLLKLISFINELII